MMIDHAIRRSVWLVDDVVVLPEGVVILIEWQPKMTPELVILN